MARYHNHDIEGLIRRHNEIGPDLVAISIVVFPEDGPPDLSAFQILQRNSKFDRTVIEMMDKHIRDNGKDLSRTALICEFVDAGERILYYSIGNSMRHLQDNVDAWIQANLP